MTLLALQMLSVNCLLILIPRASCHASAVIRRSKCVNLVQFNSLAEKFSRNYWDNLRIQGDLLPPQDNRTCVRTAKDTFGDVGSRALAPWIYKLHRDETRFPLDIVFAECLCQGCIINQREDLSYNSRPLLAPLMVLKKGRCPFDPNKFVVERHLIDIPVACVCVVPKYIA